MHTDVAVPTIQKTGITTPTFSTQETSRVAGRRFIVIRHGESMSNIQHILTSSLTAENHLTDKGRNQVRISASEIAKKVKIDVIFASPLQRTMDTASIVADAAGIAVKQIIVRPELKEPNFGSYENRPAEAYLKLFENNRQGTFTVGSPDGESGEEQAARIKTLMDELTTDATYAGKTIVLATHLYSFQHINKYLTGEYIPDAQKPQNATWCLYQSSEKA